MARLEEDLARLALSNQEVESLEERRRQPAESRATFAKENDAVIVRLSSLQRVQHLMRIVENNWTQLDGDYETARVEFAEIREVAEETRAQRVAIQANRALGSRWSRLRRRLGMRRRRSN